MSRRIEQNKQPALQIMFRLIGLMKPLLGTMIIAIVMGCVGHLVAIFITVFGGIGIGNLIGMHTNWTL